MFRLLFVLCMLLILGYKPTCAGEYSDAAEKVYLSNINALMMFTTQNGLSSGTYNFTAADAKMQIYNLPINYHFKPFYPRLNFVFYSDLGYSEVRKSIEIPSANSRSDPDLILTADNKLNTYVGGLGLGLRHRSIFDIDFIFGFEVFYSRVSQSAKFSEEIDFEDAIDNFFNANYNVNFTYKVMFVAEYVKAYRGFKPYARLGFKYFDTRADFTFDFLSAFTTQSSSTNIDFGVETPNLFLYNEMFLTLEIYIKSNYLAGDVKSVMEVEDYYSAGGVVYWYVSKKQAYIKRLFIEANSVQGRGINGYNISIGFSLDYGSIE